MRGGAVETVMLNGRIDLYNADKSKDWYPWKTTEERIRRVGLLFILEVQHFTQTAAACRRRLARLSARKVAISFVSNISLAHATSVSHRSLTRLESSCAEEALAQGYQPFIISFAHLISM